MHLECNSCGLEKLDTLCVCALNDNVVVKVRHFSVVSEGSRVQNEIVETQMTGSELLAHFRELIAPFLWHSWKKKSLLHMTELTHMKLEAGSISVKADYSALGSVSPSINLNQAIPARYYNFTAIVSFF